MSTTTHEGRVGTEHGGQPFGLKVVHTAGFVERPPNAGLSDTWVSSYDPDGHDGLGEFDTTTDPSKALHFPTIGEAIKCWRQQSTVKPLRADGEPNRPLTALTVLFERVPE